MSLKKFREKNKITQEELAYRVDVSVRTIQNIERTNNTNLKTAIKITKELNKTIKKIFFKKKDTKK